MLHEKLREVCKEYELLNLRYESIFQELLQSELPKAFSLGELKLGLEEGLNINEIAVLLGKDSHDTHENIKLYLQYRNFFRKKLNDGYAESVKAYIHAVRAQVDFDVPTELILYAKTIDDIKEKAPVVKMTAELKTEIETRVIPVGGAYYITIGTTSSDGDLLYRCFSPSDHTYYETYNEYDARKWVRDKNNHPKTIVQSRQK